MACNCSGSCDCNDGIELLVGTTGQDAPTITNITVNADNTITFTFSDSSSITTSAIDVNDPSSLSYILSHTQDEQIGGGMSVTIPANSLEATGDKLRIISAGELEEASSIALSESLAPTLDGNLIISYLNDSIGSTVHYRLELEAIRTNTTELRFQGNLYIYDRDAQDLGKITLIDNVVIDSYADVSIDVYDFTSDLEFVIGANKANPDFVNVELIIND